MRTRVLRCSARRLRVSAACGVPNDPSVRHHERHFFSDLLEAAGRADANERPHQESEIEAADVDEEPFQDVRVATQVRTAHASRLIRDARLSFQSLAPATLQPTTARLAHPSLVVDDVRTRLVMTRPQPIKLSELLQLHFGPRGDGSDDLLT